MTTSLARRKAGSVTAATALATSVAATSVAAAAAASAGHANVAHAAAASLRYVTDPTPGITRRRSGTGFVYLSANGKPVRDAAVLARIRSLVIPPAWTDVWICPTANGHLQATGRDAKGRKQHRYHERWRAVRDENKYSRLTGFARALPMIRRRVEADLASRGMTQERVLAMVVNLLEATHIRIGNEEYARTNGSYGLTTLTDDHVSIRGARMRFAFRGKSGKEHDVELNDPRLARLVKKSRDLPGEELFQYVDEDGAPHPIDSTLVNAYIRDIGGEEFTAKDFRTWAGTLLAARALDTVAADGDDDALSKAAISRAVKEVSGHLRNTPAVCRKCYIHPAVLDLFSDADALARWRAGKSKAKRVSGLSSEEAALLHYLEQTKS